MFNVAHAQEGAAQAAGIGPSYLLMWVLIIGIFYFMMIRPQIKRAKEHRELMNNLRRGDKVVTQGGIHGTIAKVADDIIHLKIADGVEIEMAKVSIAHVVVKADDVKKPATKKKAAPKKTAAKKK